MFFQSSTQYSIRKSRRLFREGFQWYKKHWKTLDDRTRPRIEQLLDSLDKATVARDRAESDRLARELESLGLMERKKSFAWYVGELIVAIAVALIVATCVRNMWFEPYKIPTGSMRPTFAEQDHLLVSKTSFGLNVPLSTSHFYFDPTLLKRSQIVIWSGDNVDLPDTDTVYFGLFPGKKRYIKRLIGTPGDSLYFYGGLIYGVDKEGKDITAELNPPETEKLDHIPFNTFEGRISVARANKDSSAYEVSFRQIQRPVGRITVSSYGVSNPEIFTGEDWIKENPLADREPHKSIQTYDDFLGMRNFAMARLLTKQQVQLYSGVDPASIGEGELYLELRHSPNLTNPKPRVGEGPLGQLRIALTPFIAVLPLQEKDLKQLMSLMYTSRFVVKNGYATAWQMEGSPLYSGSPEVPGIPDGDYEFYYGKAYSVNWGGYQEELPANHPLYSLTAQNLQFLFNAGLEVNAAYYPFATDQLTFPSRYAYFRDGDLYVMGGKLFGKEDPGLQKFVTSELAREKAATSFRPYIAFQDYGPPLHDGHLDVDFVRSFGVTVPEKQYLLLGDNHARSADSRTFGFVPEDNLQGSPVFLVWPPGSRWGLTGGSTGIFHIPNLIVWTIVIILAGLWFYREHRLNTRPLFRKMIR